MLSLLKVIFLILICLCVTPGRAQISWSKNSGSTGSGNFTISGTGSINTLNSSDNIVFEKHGSGASIYYTCNTCTINLDITGQLIIDYPVYLTNSLIIIGKTSFDNVNTTAGLTINGSLTNQKQALFLDNGSSIQLASSTNYIKLQSSPTAYIYFDYSGPENSAPSSSDKSFSANDNSSLCGITSAGSSQHYTCNKGQANGPSVLNASGFNIIAPLPVVLVDFSAKLNSNKTVELNWSTQIESNLSHFSVERSADGVNWKIIGVVQAVGNSLSESDYSFTDTKPFEGPNYYRLLMSDLDDKSGVTAIKLVGTPVTKSFRIFPNPAKDYVDITVSNSKSGNIRLLNLFGQVLQQKQYNTTTGGATVSFQLSGYPSGNYFVQIISYNESIYAEKIIVAK